MDVKKRLEELSGEFEELKKEREALVEQAKELQAKLNEVDNKLVMKKGAYEEVEKMDSEVEKKK